MKSNVALIMRPLSLRVTSGRKIGHYIISAAAAAYATGKLLA